MYPAVRLDIAHDFATTRPTRMRRWPTGSGPTPYDLSGQDSRDPPGRRRKRSGSPLLVVLGMPEMAFAAELLVTGLRELSVPPPRPRSHDWQRRAAGLQPGSVVLMFSYEGEGVAARHPKARRRPAPRCVADSPPAPTRRGVRTGWSAPRDDARRQSGLITPGARLGRRRSVMLAWTRGLPRLAELAAIRKSS